MERMARGVVCLLGLVIGVAAVRAEHDGPSENDKNITRLVCQLIQKVHITRHRIDDEIAGRLHTTFLEMFDPLKLYFEAGDVAEFDTLANQLDDMALAGDLQFVFRVRDRYEQRLKTRMAWVRELIDSEHDFSKKDTIVLDPDAATYAQNEAEAKERWRCRIKFELLSLVVDGKTLAEAKERLQRRYRNIERTRDIADDELVEMFLTALSNSFDPHSSYMGAHTLKDFEIGIQLSLEGIGALLQDDDGVTVVKEIVPGGAADKDGRLKPGDKIVGVGQGDDAAGEITDLGQLKLREVVQLIRGKAGTSVRLEVEPADAPGKKTIYALVRQKIVLQDREAKGEVLELPKGTEPGHYRIGVINLPSFYADNEAIRNGDADPKTATNDVRKILQQFEQQGVDGVIMDLRANGGGLLSEAIELTGLFIDKGPVVQVRDYQGAIEAYEDEAQGVAYGGPLLVLVSRFSASASEIFAGAIKDYGRGVVAGDSTTHGKGTVQKVVDLNRDWPGFFLFRSKLEKPGALKVTMQKFYRVNGQSTQNQGVPADIVLPATTDHDDFGESKLDYALAFDTIPVAEFARMGEVKTSVVEQLRTRSGERLRTDPELKKLAERKQQIHERRDRQVLEFDEASMRKEREEIKGQDDDPPEEETRKPEKFGTRPYDKEVLAIMSDYLHLSTRPVTTSR